MAKHGKQTGKYRSQLEAMVAIRLQLYTKFNYESIKLKYSFDYIPDFILPNGIMLEVKGVLLAEDIRKMRAVKEQNPEADIRFVFQKASAKVPTRKLTHAEWAEKNGFQWCEKTVPIEWMKYEE